MIEIIIKHTIAFLYLLSGSVSDIKTREVADWSNYGLIAIAIASNLIFSVISKDPTYILTSLLGFGVFLGMALLLFYTGQWGGGDSKMLMGLGALYGLGFNWQHSSFLALFVVNTLIAGGIYGLVWSVTVAVRHRKHVIKEYKKLSSGKSIKHTKRILLWIVLLCLLLIFILRIQTATFLLLSLAVVILSTLYLWLFVKAVENSAMYKLVTPSQLTEGDWIAKEVRYRGKYICGPKDLGIEKKQIEKLKGLYRKKKIQKILIKEGLPFVPSFFLGWFVTVLFGNILRFLP